MKRILWYPCPKCGFDHMMKYRQDTKAENIIVFCKKCKTENVISINNSAKCRI